MQNQKTETTQKELTAQQLRPIIRRVLDDNGLKPSLINGKTAKEIKNIPTYNYMGVGNQIRKEIEKEQKKLILTIESTAQGDATRNIFNTAYANTFKKGDTIYKIVKDDKEYYKIENTNNKQIYIRRLKTRKDKPIEEYKDNKIKMIRKIAFSPLYKLYTEP